MPMDMDQAMGLINFFEQQRKTEFGEVMAMENLALRKSGVALSAEKEFRMQRKEATDNVKSVFTSLMNSYHQAKSPALQESIRGTMKTYVHAAPKWLKPALAPYINHSPISALEEKRRQFLKHNPTPREPDIVAGEDPQIYNQRWAAFKFQQADHKRALTGSLYGTAAQGPRMDFLSLGESGAVIRDQGGRTTLFSREDLTLKEISDRTGRPIPEIVASGGWSDPVTMGKVIKDGKLYTKALRRNQFTGESEVFNQDIQSAPSTDITYPSGLHTLIDDVIGDNTKNEAAVRLRGWILEKEGKNRNVAANFLRANYPGFHFTIESFKSESDWPFPFSWIAQQVEGDDIAIYAVPGRPVPLEGGSILYQDQTGRTRNKHGYLMGNSLEEAEENILRNRSTP